MKKLHLLLPFALLALGLGLVACGGGGDSDEDKIVEVIETSVTSDDPAECKKLSTQAFLEQTQATEGAKALESCEENAKDTSEDPDSVEVSEVEVDGSSASANVAFTGGSFDGQILTLSLVDEDGDWKLAEITGFAEFDQEKLVSSFEEAFESEEDVPPQLATCIIETIRELPKAEAEQLVIGGSQEPTVEIVEGCTEGLE